MEEKQTAVADALNDAKNKATPPDIKASEEYKALEADFNNYKAKQTARGSAEFKDVKDKFFDIVYDKVDRAEGAKPVAEQLTAIKAEYEKYFNIVKNIPGTELSPGSGMLNERRFRLSSAT